MRRQHPQQFGPKKMLDFGITRLADQTGLDIVGVPVWAAIRPNARSLSVCNGKGVTHDEARLTALMEGVETHLAETPERLTLWKGSLHELHLSGRQSVDFTSVFKSLTASPDAERKRYWIEGYRLCDKSPIWAPVELVGLDMRVDADLDRDSFLITSVGLAAHTERDKAILAALLETIEHDAIALAFSWPGVLESMPLLDPTQMQDADFSWLMSMVKDAKLDPVFLDVTTDIGLPVVICLLQEVNSGLNERAALAMGSASNLVVDRAMRAALLEALQSRVTDIAGARDDIKASDFIRLPSAEHRPRYGKTVAQVVSSHSSPSALGAAHSIETVRLALKRVGLDDPIIFDLAQDFEEFDCFSVLCPGLEIGATCHGVRVGQRSKKRIISYAQACICNE